MSILGLDGTPEQEENIFKRIFWPRNEPYAVDSLGQQGFWVCFGVGLISGVVSLITGHPLLAILVICFYWMGGVGVREHSVPAAILVTGAYFLSVGLVIWSGRPPGLLDIAIGVILLSNIRGTYIASAWKRTGDPDLFPDRMKTTFRDKLVDQWPRAVWPKGKFVFFSAGFCYGVLLVLGMIGTAHLRAQRGTTPAVTTEELKIGPQ